MAEVAEATVLGNVIWTYLDYLELPENGKRYQVIQGVLYMTPAPSSWHQEASRNLEFILWEFVKKQKLGKVFDAPIDVILSSTDVVQPDLVFVAKKKSGLIRKEGIFGAPDLIIEIVSPSSRKMDELLKKSLYEQHGVAEYLIVYPDERQVVQYVLTGGKYQQQGTFLATDSLPLKSLSLNIPLSEVFAEE